MKERQYYHYFVMMPPATIRSLLNAVDAPHNKSASPALVLQHVIDTLREEGTLAFEQEDDFPFFELVLMYLYERDTMLFNESYNWHLVTNLEVTFECYGIADKQSAGTYLDKRASGQLSLDDIYLFLCSIDWNNDLWTVDDIMEMLQTLDEMMQYVVDKNVTLVALCYDKQIEFKR